MADEKETKYEVRSFKSSELDDAALERCADILKTGGAVDTVSVEQLRRATKLVLARKGGEIVGVGTIKGIRKNYTARIAGAKKSGFAFPAEIPELGYVAVDPGHRQKGLAHGLLNGLLKDQAGALFATTYDPYMKKTLAAAGFAAKGKEWKGRKQMLSLWLRDQPSKS